MQLLNDAIKKRPMVLQIAIMIVAARSGSPHNVLVLQIAVKNEVNRFLCTCTKHVSLSCYNNNYYKQVRPLAALASLRVLRPAIGRPQRAQC